MKNSMFYLVENHQIGNKPSLEKGVIDIASKGFDSVLLQIRDTSFQMDDPEIVDVVDIIVRKCHQLGLKCVLTFVTTTCRPWFRSFFKKYPQAGDIIVFKGESRMSGSEFEIPVDIPSATGAYLSKMEDIVKVFIKEGDRFKPLKKIEGRIESVCDYGVDKNLDWYNKPAKLIFYGRIKSLKNKCLVAYFSLRIGHPDYACQRFRTFTDSLLEKYKNIPLDGVAWDEPGVPGDYGYHKLSPFFCKRFIKEHGYDILDKLYLLDYNVRGSALVRYHYFCTLRNCLFDAQKKFVSKARELFGKDIVSGIHQTWQAGGNSADLRAGNCDYFYLAKNLTGGFTDCGMSIEKPMYYTIALARSIAKTTRVKEAYHNASETNSDYKRIRHYTRLMALNKVWLIGHAYGHAAGSFGPGFPYSRCWSEFLPVTRRIKQMQQLLEGFKEDVKIAVYHSWANGSAINTEFNENYEAAKVRIASILTVANVPFDFVGEEQLSRSRISSKSLLMGEGNYTLLIVPWVNLITVGAWQKIREFYEAGGQIIFLGLPGEKLTDGKDIARQFFLMVEAEPFSSKDCMKKYYKRYRNPRDVFGAEKQKDFVYPLKGRGKKILYKGKAIGIKNREKPVYYFSRLGLEEELLPILKELCCSPPVRYIPDKKAGRVFFKLYRKGEEQCLVAAGDYDSTFSGTFKWNDHAVSVKGSKFLGVKICESGYVAVGEENDRIRVLRDKAILKHV